MVWIKNGAFWLFGTCLLVILSFLTPVAWWLLYMDEGSPKGAWTASRSDQRVVSAMMFTSLVAWGFLAILLFSQCFGWTFDQLPTWFAGYSLIMVVACWIVSNVTFGFGVRFHTKNSFMRNPKGIGMSENCGGHHDFN